MVKLRKMSLLGATAIVAQAWVLAPAAFAQDCTPGTATSHPAMQARVLPSMHVNTGPDADLSQPAEITVSEGIFPSQDPFANPPGSNFLGDAIESNIFDSNCSEMLNTLPSTEANPYNLHPDPVITEIDATSPTQDLDASFQAMQESLDTPPRKIDKDAINLAIDILEGNAVPGRNYSGFPVLHYNGPLKIKDQDSDFEIFRDGNGVATGGNINVRQIWFDNHIEGDTNMIRVPDELLGVPWQMTTSVDTLYRGHEDFSPYVMYFDDPALNPGGPPPPGVAMDQSFFPMEEGTRTVYELQMSQGKYWNLTYFWGWRWHPPRVQVTENARKMFNGKSLAAWEIDTFGENPRANEFAKLQAISKIGHLAPARRMWSSLRLMRFLANLPGNSSGKRALLQANLNRAFGAFQDWKNRNLLPFGVEPDPDSDVTLFYVNNTIYGQIGGDTGAGNGAVRDLMEFRQRPFQYKVHLINGDFYPRYYVNIDFGGLRGWENTFQSTIPIAGAGPWFTFGRHYWWVNAGLPVPQVAIEIPKARGFGRVGRRDAVVNYNHEPNRRLRIYQFDAAHHDIAVWSMH